MRYFINDNLQDGRAQILAFDPVTLKMYVYEEVRDVSAIPSPTQGLGGRARTISEIFEPAFKQEKSPNIEVAKELIAQKVEPLEITRRTGLPVSQVFALMQEITGSIPAPAPVDLTKGRRGARGPRAGSRKEDIRRLLLEGLDVTEITNQLGISGAYVYIVKRELKDSGQWPIFGVEKKAEETPVQQPQQMERFAPYVTVEQFDSIRRLHDMGYTVEDATSHVDIPASKIKEVYDAGPNFAVFEEKYQFSPEPAKV